MNHYNHKKRKLALLLFIANLAFLFANNFQNFRFKHINIFDGLPHNSVSSIAQDADGYMWFATRNGLCRYDGYNLLRYVNDPDDTTSVSNSFITNLLNDSVNNCLWVATDEGFCKYIYATRKFKQYEIQKRNTFFVVKDFYQLKNGKLILITTGGLYQYNAESDRFSPFFSDNHDKNFEINGVVQDAFNTLWMATNAGLFTYNLETNERISKIPPLSAYQSLRSNRISNIRIGKANQLWVALDRSEMFVLDPSQNTIKKIPGFENNVFRSLMYDRNGYTWIGSENGILVYDNQLQLTHHFQHKEIDLSNLGDNAIYNIIEDKSGNIWIATYFSGVNYFINGSQSFTVFAAGKSKQHLSGKAPRQIIAGKNNDIWVATEDGGLNYINEQNNQITSFGLNTKPFGLKTQNIHSLLYDRNNKLWIGTFGRGLTCFDNKTGRILQYKDEDNNNQSSYVFCINEDKEGDIWTGTLSGLYYYNKANDKFITLNWTKELSSRFVFCMATDKTGNSWIGTRRDGLYKLNKLKKSIQKINFSNKEVRFITYLFVDSVGNIWAGTNIGLFVINPDGKQLTSYTVKNGLPSNAIKALIEEKRNIVWITTDQGLSRLDVSSKTIQNFTTNDGIPVNQFNYASACKSPNGKLYFGTINGLISFDPVRIIKNDNTFKVRITDLIANGMSIPLLSKAEQSQLSKVKLKYDQAKSFTVEFSGMNYRYGSNTHYSIKLEGADNEWQNIGKQHQINFSNLSHGKYLLHVKAGIDDLNWDENGTTILEIIILPPFWLSIWAYMLYTLILVVLLNYIYKFSKSRLNLMINLKAEKSMRMDMEELNRQKIDFFTYISHDLKTPLTLILSPLQRLYQHATNEAEKSKLEVILRNANRMHYLVDELLTLSKIEMKQMRINVRKGDVFLFIAEVSRIFELYAKDKNIDFSLQLQPNQGIEVWFSPSKLERIIYNLLTNAFKYTRPNGMVLLTAKLITESEFSFLELTVEDSGRGIPENQLKQIFENYYQVEKTDHYKGFGIGLSLTKSLVTIHKGTIDVESREGEGTKFIVKINVSENAYDAEQRLSEGISFEDIQKHNDRMQQTLALLPEYNKHNRDSSDNRPTLLIVEDNEEMNNYLEDIFATDYRVIKAYNGQEGYKLVFKEIPDLIISDVMMPVMNGIEFLKKIKNNLSTSHIPIVLLTAKTDEADFTEGYLHGADAYITKPFNAQNLELLVSNLQKTKVSNIDRFKQEEDLNVSQLASNPRDVKFIENLVKLIHDNIQDENFGVTEIVANMAVSRSLLHTKLKSLANASVTEFVRSIKMKEARKHLMNGLNVSEASYSVGMSDPNYFTKCFKKQFNVTPTEFINSLKK